MQSDRRHDLDSNALADSVAALAERVRPHLATLGLAAVALLLGFAAWSMIDAQRVAAREESWDACLAALATGQAPALDAVAARYPDSPAAQWAELVLADGMLEQGSQALAVDRAQAEERLQAAAARFTALLVSNPLPFIAERATFGLAKARENLGSLDDAVRGYEALVRDYPDSAVRRLAEARIAALGRDSTRQWYAWFAQQKPARPAATDGSAQPAAEPDPGTAGPGGESPAATGSGTDAPG